MTSPQLARQITYSGAAASRPGRLVVRLLENAGGRLGLIRRVRGYEAELAQGRDLWTVMCERCGIRIEVAGGRIDAIPREGPLVVVANHPFGILDGLVLGRILSERRGSDFRILANSVFGRAPELARVLLPIDFSPTREAAARNLATRDEALALLARGGAIGIFPGGTVSTAPTPFGPPLDPAWRSFTAKLAAQPGVTVVPIFFEGANSRLFQVASHLSYALRLGLLLPEFGTRVDSAVRLVVGAPVPRAEIDAFGRDASGLMTFLRERTYALSPRPVPPNRLGHEFEARYRTGRRGRTQGARPLAPALPEAGRP